MELRLSDPKKKDDDMGVILVDVCLMFRDATIKKGLVRGDFSLMASIRSRRVFHSFFLNVSFTEMGTEEKQGMEFNFFPTHTSIFQGPTRNSLACPAFNKAVFTVALKVPLTGNTRGQYHTAL